MKNLVYLYGSPSAGKSTTAASVYTSAKKFGLVTGLVYEVASSYIEKGESLPKPAQLMREQLDLELQKMRSCNFVVSDSPPIIGYYYASTAEERCTLKAMMDEHSELVRDLGFTVDCFYLTRITKYSDANRLHSEQESDNISKELIHHVMENNPEDYSLTLVPKRIPIEFRDSYILSKIGLFK